MELISSIDIAGDTVTVRADERFADVYLRDDFKVKYDLPGDAWSIAEGLAVVPFIANVAPVVWLSGLDVRVPTLDITFASALNAIHTAFTRMYPSLDWNGSITPDRLTSVDASSEQVAQLFTGGVDSVYTALSTDEAKLLITVRGSDIALDNDVGWDAVRSQAMKFAHERGHRNVFIESNLRHFLDIPALERRWPAVDEWWPGVQHGIGLLGLAAPVIHAGRVVIAATHTPTFSGKSMGSNPGLDTALRWGGATVEHHGYAVSRQEKIEAIVAFKGPRPQLRVCFGNPYGNGGNCGLCEKCLRTFSGLLAAGVDPSKYGMPMSREKGARTVRRRFKMYRVAFNITKTWHWGQIQEALRNNMSSLGEGTDDGETARFLRWFSAFDFAIYERRWKGFLRIRKRALRLLRSVPGAESAVRRCVAVSLKLRARLGH